VNEGSGRRIIILASVEPAQLGLGKVFSRARDAIIVAEASLGRIVLWNDAAAQMFGYTPEEAFGLLVEDLVHPSFKRQHRAGLAAYGRTGHGALIDSGMQVELPAVRKDGRELWVELSLTPLDVDGVPGPYAMAIVRDVTERKESDRLLRQSHAALEGTQALAKVGSWEWDVGAAPTGGVVWSKQMYAIHGVDPETFDMSRDAVDALIHPEDLDTLASALAETATSGRDLGGFTYRAVRPDGAVRWIWTEGRFHPDRPGVVLGFVQDITERKAAADELERLALVDELTGLRNRRGFLTAAEPLLRIAHRERHDVVVLYIDLDNMKAINDRYGHAAGDQALADTAALLRDTFRESDLIARLGGDEFCVLLYASSLDTPVERLMASLAAGPARTPAIELSVGAALRPGSEATPVEELLRRADAAMYVDKGAKAPRPRATRPGGGKRRS